MKGAKTPPPQHAFIACTRTILLLPLRLNRVCYLRNTTALGKLLTPVLMIHSNIIKE